MKRLLKDEKGYLDRVGYFSGSYYDAPHTHLGDMTPEQAELSDRLVARGLMIYVKCPREECPYVHPQLTAAGRLALECDAAADVIEIK